ncbi:MAG: hypothetical protein ACR2LR_19050 [Hassallia sp.]
MYDFKEFLGLLFRFLISFIFGFGTLLTKHKEFLVGILAIAVIFYITYELFFNKKEDGNKYHRVITVFLGFVLGIISSTK